MYEYQAARNLVLAVLVQAVQEACLDIGLKPVFERDMEPEGFYRAESAWKRQDRLRRQARAWINSTNNEYGSFQWYCHLSGVSTDAIQDRLSA